MSDAVIIDTNIVVYAHDADTGEKHQRAVDVLQKLRETDTGRRSVKVLQEFYVNVIRKLMTRLAVRRLVR